MPRRLDMASYISPKYQKIFKANPKHRSLCVSAKCSVIGCSSIGVTASMHRFPKNKTRCLAWLAALENRYDQRNKPVPLEKMCNRYICGNHFHPSSKIGNSLKKNALPILFDFPQDTIDNNEVSSDECLETFEPRRGDVEPAGAQNISNELGEARADSVGLKTQTVKCAAKTSARQPVEKPSDAAFVPPKRKRPLPSIVPHDLLHAPSIHRRRKPAPDIPSEDLDAARPPGDNPQRQQLPDVAWQNLGTSRICRFCLKPARMDLDSVRQIDGASYTVSQLMLMYTVVHYAEEWMPTGACEACVEHLERAHSFHNMCRRAHNHLETLEQQRLQYILGLLNHQGKRRFENNNNCKNYDTSKRRKLSHVTSEEMKKELDKRSLENENDFDEWDKEKSPTASNAENIEEIKDEPVQTSLLNRDGWDKENNELDTNECDLVQSENQNSDHSNTIVTHTFKDLDSFIQFYNSSNKLDNNDYYLSHPAVSTGNQIDPNITQVEVIEDTDSLIYYGDKIERETEIRDGPKERDVRLETEQTVRPVLLLNIPDAQLHQLMMKHEAVTPHKNVC